MRKISSGIFLEKGVKLTQNLLTGGACMKAEDFADIYMEFADKIGVDAAVAIHEMFKGQQILFPQKL